MNPPPPPDGNAETREPDEPEEAGRTDFDPSYRSDEPILCDLCGSAMRYTASCRITCPNCGYTRDCSDP